MSTPADQSPTQRNVERRLSERTLPGEESDKPSHQRQNSDVGDGKESQKQDGPPEPVGFFHPSLHKTRIEVIWKWMLTSETKRGFLKVFTDESSYISYDLHYCRSVPVLGRAVPSSREHEILDDPGCGL